MIAAEAGKHVLWRSRAPLNAVEPAPLAEAVPPHEVIVNGLLQSQVLVRPSNSRGYVNARAIEERRFAPALYD